MLDTIVPSRRRLARILSAAILTGLAAFFLASSASASPWSEVRYPSSGMTEVIGGPSNGCIGGADALPAAGPGYVSVRRYRNRYYGHPNLLRFITDLGRVEQRRHQGLVMIGDLSQPRGGRMSSSHRSHQNGLDVDIWLTLASSPDEAHRLMDHRSDPRSMVASGGRQVSADWGEAQRDLIETAARHPGVDRIFVNAAIKRELCRAATGDRSWLRKVRPWWKHDSHMHVRLSCPPGSMLCKPQAPVPPGDGCGKELSWWLSDEALHPKKGGSKRSTEPVMPAACSAVLHDS